MATNEQRLDAPTVTGEGAPGGEQPVIGAPVIAPPAAGEPIKQRDPRGRHRKDCTCAVCRSRRGEKVGNARPRTDSPLAASPTIDPALVKDTVDRLCQIASDVICRRVGKLATVATGGNAAITAELVADCALTDSERTTIVELTGTLAEKYGVAFQYAPEAALCLCVVGYGWRVSQVQKQLATLAQARQQTPPAAK